MHKTTGTPVAPEDNRPEPERVKEAQERMRQTGRNAVLKPTPEEKKRRTTFVNDPRKAKPQ